MWGLSGSGASNLMDDSFLQVSVGFFTIFLGGGSRFAKFTPSYIGKGCISPRPPMVFALFSKNLTYSNGVT